MNLPSEKRTPSKPLNPKIMAALRIMAQAVLREHSKKGDLAEQEVSNETVN